MVQEEVLLLKRGQPQLRKDIRTIIKILEKENVLLGGPRKLNYLFFVLSDFARMSREAELRSINVSYFPSDIFLNKSIEIIAHFSHRKPIELFKQKIANVSGKIEVYVREEDESINFFAFMEKPDWEVEERIYSAYSDLLNTFPDISFSLEVTDLFGKKVKDFMHAHFKSL